MKTRGARSKKKKKIKHWGERRKKYRPLTDPKAVSPSALCCLDIVREREGVQDGKIIFS